MSVRFDKSYKRCIFH